MRRNPARPVTKPVTVLTGGQYGSEAKGIIGGYLVERDGISHCVRTGATNAGHTVEYRGAYYAMQQIPVGWVNPHTELVIGAGALIDPDILRREIAMINDAFGDGSDVRSRLTIDPRAFIHRPEHADRSKRSDRHHAIGATGKGCSEAMMDRIRLRGTPGRALTVRDDDRREFANVNVDDTELLLNRAIDEGASVMLEGCQGTLLDLYLGPYPFTTHKQTTPAQWMSECGLSPALPTRIVMVVRTMPIRVAGNSGPLDNEMSWPEVARMINARREAAGCEPVVAESAIHQFEDAVRAAVAAEDMFIPVNSDGLDQHKWSVSDRVRFRAALSELNARAIAALPAGTVKELRKLFELTTVTKKLRRIAGLSHHDLMVAGRQVRPHEVAVTFMNYLFPDKWHERRGELTVEERSYLRSIEDATGAPVTLINRGPAIDHIEEA